MARMRAVDARNALSMQIDGSDATSLQKAAMRESLIALWTNAQDAWTSLDDGGTVYPSLQTAIKSDDESGDE